jgi:hypothetical protein
MTVPTRSAVTSRKFGGSRRGHSSTSWHCAAEGQPARLARHTRRMQLVEQVRLRKFTTHGIMQCPHPGHVMASPISRWSGVRHCAQTGTVARICGRSIIAAPTAYGPTCSYACWPIASNGKCAKSSNRFCSRTRAIRSWRCELMRGRGGLPAKNRVVGCRFPRGLAFCAIRQ